MPTGDLVILSLSSAGAAGLAIGRIAPWVVATVAVVFLGAGLIFYVRRRLLADGETGDPTAGLLDQLRRARERGEMTEEEFEDARLVMIARATGRDLETLRAEAIRKAGGRVAEPGFDLLGRPLPVRPSAAIPGGSTPPDSGGTR
jgi:hypothetical protein